MRHHATLALVGWYLMVPPPVIHSNRWGLCGGLQPGGVGGRVKRDHTAGDDLHPLKASFA